MPEDLILLQSSIDLLAAARREQGIGWKAFGPVGMACTSGLWCGVGVQKILYCLNLQRVADLPKSIRQANLRSGQGLHSYKLG